MKTSYNNISVSFTMEYIKFNALHFVFERFLRSIPSHSHSDNSYEIHYIPFGHGKVRINQELYQVVPNTLYITGPFIEHEQIPDKDDPMAEYCIYFKIDKKKRDIKKKIDSSYMELFETTHFWFGQDQQNIHSIMQKIFSELELKYVGYMKQIEVLLQQLVISLIRNYVNPQEITTHNKFTDLSYSKYFIIEEYFLYEYKSLSLDTLSDRLGLSTRQTERLIIRHYGKTFLQKRTEAKMSAAAILLMDPNKRISEIASDLGYSSVEHFSTAFRRYYNTSAREYRKNSLNISAEQKNDI
ncbi:helix-turn-helix transcriptional regulator [Lachnospiraceae bacterium MD1]|jgi:AraC-like DNA-binding protein|uniref:Helix-turn-helix transcriptional regulator n=1 Tax=Variimorphobacter saccharofermentans TaxID=2755051 RepID=A0A839K3B3_9FIRM|nr:AraC family transcriptional regulator [Variimorphobacter saccharofermentans]MBB2183868.1 helix-turn-helix transcriptional regulator [Variimorphobacter saccharofermentans]